MDRQPKLRPMEPNSFFKNGMSSQPLVEGTIARSEAIDLGAGKKVYPFEKDHVAVSGFVKKLILKHKVDGKLSVAKLA